MSPHIWKRPIRVIRTAALLAALACLPGCTGIGSDSGRVDPDTTARLKKAEDDLKTAQIDLGKVKTQLRDAESDRDTARKNSQDVAKKLTDAQGESNSLRTQLTESEAGRARAEAGLRLKGEEVQGLRDEIDRKAKALQGVSTELDGARKDVNDKKARIANHERRIKLLEAVEARYRELTLNPLWHLNLKDYEGAPYVTVKFVRDKGDEAEKVCRQLGWEVLEREDRLYQLRCKPTRPVTAETLETLRNTSIIRAFQPARPAATGPAGNRTGTTRREPRPPSPGSLAVGRDAPRRPASGAAAIRPVSWSPRPDPTATRALYERHPLPGSRHEFATQWNFETIAIRKLWDRVSLYEDPQGTYKQRKKKDLNPVLVAVIDHGFDITVPALAESVNRETCANVNVEDQSHDDDRKNAKDELAVRLLPPKDMETDIINYNHGTHVAGIVANAANLRGEQRQAARPVQLMLLKANTRSSAQIQTAIMDAADKGADVIVLSLGLWRKKARIGESTDPARPGEYADTKPDADLEFGSALAYATRPSDKKPKRSLVVCAVGQVEESEAGKSSEEPTSYADRNQFIAPACWADPDFDGYKSDDSKRNGYDYPDPNYVVAVGALSKVDGATAAVERWKPSNFGRPGTILWAPGGGTGPSSVEGVLSYAVLQEGQDDSREVKEKKALELIGTSQAAPHVAAVAALLIALPEPMFRDLPETHDDDRAAQVKARLLTLHASNQEFLDLSAFGPPTPPETIPGRTARGLRPEDYALYRQALEAYLQQDQLTAVALFEEAVRKLPGCVEPLYYLAFARAAVGNLAGADAALRDALRNDRSLPIHPRDWKDMMGRIPGHARAELEQLRERYQLNGILPDREPILAAWNQSTPSGGPIVAGQGAVVVFDSAFVVSSPCIPCPLPRRAHHR